jgi:hypothetical protein
MPEPRRPLSPGDVIHRNAGGAFGRDHNECVRIEAVGPDWIVAGDPEERRWRTPVFASGRRALEQCQQARDGGCVECPIREDPPLTTWQRPA